MPWEKVQAVGLGNSINGELVPAYRTTKLASPAINHHVNTSTPGARNA
jgi:hypothetical protein